MKPSDDPRCNVAELALARVEKIPMIGYTGGLERRHVRPSREHPRRARRHGQRRCGVVRFAGVGRTRGDGSLAAGIRTNPSHAASERTRHAQQAFAHQRTRAAAQSERTQSPQGSRAFRLTRHRASARRRTGSGPVGLVPADLLQQRLDRGFEGSEIVAHDPPDARVLHPRIVVAQDVARPATARQGMLLC